MTHLHHDRAYQHPQARVRDLMTPASHHRTRDVGIAAYRLMRTGVLGISGSREDGRLVGSASTTCGWCCPRQPPASLPEVPC